MLDKKIAFIGCGNMASAIIKGLCKNPKVDPQNIIASRRTVDQLESLKNEYGIDITTNNSFACEVADIVVLCVKPHMIERIAQELKDKIHPESTIVSIAAGVSLLTLHEYFPNQHYIFRAMPNTPAQVQEGMTALCIGNHNQEDSRVKDILELFSNCGKCEILDESLFSAFIGVSGSSPAYFYMMIEAIADGAVLEGMPRDIAYKFAAQAMLGSAKMILETQEHPGRLKDNVCSPKGTTIEAVSVLEKNGFRNAIIQAVVAAAEKNKSME
ncbi:pyrroline-5-carboxylate reductase [Anaerorhabdus furcosa]|uniref:Pyrroline-5-carboxylate reductase n=1 Tax=Anaerorhabdus furcosa TaxID=118967 RepID=A0A1T4MQT2_9FIRM|nr:pyrroline-5-carboxylate reductase [Anaerorhabdus furcosa]SJZ69187.1 pyrroline-5-carboxylate reductase [Anaerorhabdus furcosa]